MKVRKCLISTAAILLLSILLVSCASKSTSTTQTTAKVQKGTLSVDISASGNLALAKTADLAFDISGYVYKVNVEVGDQVKKGDVVAQVDPSDWESQKVSLQKAVIQSKISLDQAQIALEQAENPTTTTSTTSGAVSVPDPLDIETKQLTVDMANMTVDSAQKELDRYLQTSYEITAPFDGIVTAVNVTGGAEIYKGSVAVTIADPTKFKAEILVNELDIGQLEVGMPATVAVSASAASTFNAEVTKIAPTGTNSSGVVSYEVTVELLSDEESKALESAKATTSTTDQSSQQPAAAGNSSGGSTSQMQPPSGAAGVPPSGTGGTPPTGQQGTPPSGGAQPSDNQSSTTTTGQLTLDQLKDGYSVTITITIQQKENVLMVVSKAISRQGGKTIVKIPKGDKTEMVVVTTGISNDEYTEITSGLTEGQEYVTSTTSSTKTSSSSSTAGALQMGGGGGSPPSGGGPGGGF
jgi:HlyD family secretion protein